MRQRPPCRRIAVMIAPCAALLIVLYIVFVASDSGDDDERQADRTFRRPPGPSCHTRRAYSCVAFSYYSALGCYTVAKSLILARTSCPIIVLATTDVPRRTVRWIEAELGPQVRTRVIENKNKRKTIDASINVIDAWAMLSDYEKV